MPVYLPICEALLERHRYPMRKGDSVLEKSKDLKAKNLLRSVGSVDFR